MHLSLPKQFPLFILASFVCWSLQCLISALTQGDEGGHLFGLTCSVVLWGGRITGNKYYWRVWGVLAVFQLHWVCPVSQHVCFHGLYFSGSRLLCRELSEVGLGLRAPLKSKPLRFRFSSTLQRCRLSWAFVLCPSQVRASQVTRYLVSAVTPTQVGSASYSLPHPSRSVFWVYNWTHFLRCAMCLFWGADLWLKPSQLMSTTHNPKNSWLAMEPVCSLVEDASLGPRLPLSGSDCPLPACLRGGMGWSASC